MKVVILISLLLLFVELLIEVKWGDKHDTLSGLSILLISGLVFVIGGDFLHYGTEFWQNGSIGLSIYIALRIILFSPIYGLWRYGDWSRLNTKGSMIDEIESMFPNWMRLTFRLLALIFLVYLLL